jgi:hypothetical protein
MVVLLSIYACNGGIQVFFYRRFVAQVSTREDIALEELGV